MRRIFVWFLKEIEDFTEISQNYLTFSHLWDFTYAHSKDSTNLTFGCPLINCALIELNVLYCKEMTPRNELVAQQRSSEADFEQV